jgi:hypothetical protein
MALVPCRVEDGIDDYGIFSYPILYAARKWFGITPSNLKSAFPDRMTERIVRQSSNRGAHGSQKFDAGAWTLPFIPGLGFPQIKVDFGTNDQTKTHLIQCPL